MVKRDVVKLIREFNAGRDPVRLAIKYRILRDSPFAFLRGTAHLFCDFRGLKGDGNRVTPEGVQPEEDAVE